MAAPAQRCYEDPLRAQQSVCPVEGRPRHKQLVTLLCAGGARGKGQWGLRPLLFTPRAISL
eukprot:2282535-Pyramimonas_sp.AAC.1